MLSEAEFTGDRRRVAYVTLGMLVMVNVMSQLDRQIMSVLIEPIRTDLALSDTEMGFIVGMAFAVFYTVAGLPLGRLADLANRKNVIVTVPWPNMGFMRRVYPGFLQLSGFMQMNLDRHVNAHVQQFNHLVRGDGDSAAAHQAFYDEYLAVMDLTAEFYLQTVETVFQKHLIPLGQFTHRDHLVDPGAIRDIGLMTVEGEKDDITGRGQTGAAQDLCVNLPDEKKLHYVQPKVGHYGVFNGSRFRHHIQPKIRDFIRARRQPVQG